MKKEKYTRDEIRQKFVEFFEADNMHSELIQVADNYPEQSAISLTYEEMTLWSSTEFARYVVLFPKRSLDEAKKAVKEVLDEEKEIDVRVCDLMDNRTKIVRDLRSKDVGEYIAIEGMVRKSSEVRPKIINAAFRCLSCGAEFIKEQQQKSGLDEPLECLDCDKSSNKTNFMHIPEESELKDFQTLEIQESPEGLRGGEQPQKLDVWVDGDLVDEVNPGDRVTINGVLEGKPKGSKMNPSQIIDIYLNGEVIEIEEYEFEQLNLNDEDIKKIEEAAEDPRIFARIVNSIAPSIYGLNTEKIGLTLQLFGGVRKEMPDGTITRGDIHILMIGDPGTAKSQLLRYISELSPRGMYASGKGSTGAGLTAAAVQEEVMGETQWILEAGTLVLADGGIACVDELDKMSDNDRSAMHEAMEQQKISIAKAGINATLNTRCAVLAAANPEYGRFELHENIPSQIDLPAPLVSRFDLIFTLMDERDAERDEQMSNHIVELHKNGELLENGMDIDVDESFKPEFDKEFLKKYIARARQIDPIMSEDVMEKLSDFFIEVREEASDDGAMPITARQLESLVRLAEASARAHLREEVTTEDAERAIDVTRYFLQTAASTESGDIDIDLVESDVDNDSRTMLTAIRETVRAYEEYGGVHEEKIIDQLTPQYEEEELRKEIERMRSNGDIYTFAANEEGVKYKLG